MGLPFTQKNCSRRALVKGMAAGLAGLNAFSAGRQSVRDWSGTQPVRYPDPDVITIEREFNKYRIAAAVIEAYLHGVPMGGGASLERCG